jgi:hypothetical protein
LTHPRCRYCGRCDIGNPSELELLGAALAGYVWRGWLSETDIGRDMRAMASSAGGIALTVYDDTIRRLRANAAPGG